MVSVSNVTISVITATYNASEHLPRLIDSLAAQTDQDFEWVVADGASTDSTLELLEGAKTKLKRVIVDSRPDFGIYDALNRAIKLASGEYYLVMGADDELFPEAIAQYKKAAAKSKADLVTAKVKIGSTVVTTRKPRWLWLFGPSAIISSHAVGTLIKRELHEKHGLYNFKRYLIYADSAWLLHVLHHKPSVEYLPYVCGCFSTDGMSNRSQLISFTEQLRAQVEIGGNIYLQTFLFMLRVIKWGHRLSSRSRSSEVCH